jgi:threonine dehydrogenase-like Zn-dependent dehydrogenase
MPSCVKAAVMTQPGKIETQVFPYPQVSKDTAIVKVRLAGVCGTDVHLFRGRNKDLQCPIIMGHENLVEIVEIGEEAATRMEFSGQKLAVGDRIVPYPGHSCGHCWYCKNLPAQRYGPMCNGEGGACYGLAMRADQPPYLTGGFAEHMLLLPWVDAFKVPDGLPDEIAVLTDIFAGGTGILKTMQPSPMLQEGFRPTGTVAIQGAGPMGLAAAVTARIFGAYQVILIGGPAHRLEIARKLGVVDAIIDLDEVPDPAERVRQVQALTQGGVGPDLVVDATNVATALREGLEMVRRGGTYLETGSFEDTGDVTINVFKHICSKDVYLMGHFGSPPASYGTALKVIDLAWKRGIPLDLLVTDCWPLEKTQQAFESKLGYGGIKSVIDPRL